jgi:hypothetical protein
MGKYNVGLLVFRQADGGLACVRRWREQCLEWCYDRVEPTRFGDQKYLDDWPDRYEGVVILQHKGAGLRHASLGNYRYRHERGRVWVDDDPLIFYHFSLLRVITGWLYDPSVWVFSQRMDWVVRRYVYAPYARELRSAAKLVRSAGGRVHPVDSLRDTDNKLLSIASMARHGSFLVVTDWFAL